MPRTKSAESQTQEGMMEGKRKYTRKSGGVRGKGEAEEILVSIQHLLTNGSAEHIKSALETVQAQRIAAQSQYEQTMACLDATETILKDVLDKSIAVKSVLSATASPITPTEPTVTAKRGKRPTAQVEEEPGSQVQQPAAAEGPASQSLPVGAAETSPGSAPAAAAPAKKRGRPKKSETSADETPAPTPALAPAKPTPPPPAEDDDDAALFKDDDEDDDKDEGVATLGEADDDDEDEDEDDVDLDDDEDDEEAEETDDEDEEFEFDDDDE